MRDKMRSYRETCSVGLCGMLIAFLLGTALVEPVTSQTEHVLLNCTFEDPTICNFKFDRNHSQAEWIRHRGQTPSSRTGPDGDHTTGDGYYMYMEASRVLPDSQARLQFPPLPRSTTPR
ncbi:MAM domain-containing protein 2-like [Lingula anatina]|uniref:MAM domain-containing protein 2-like n=1 Tax=Lingula anatina TaxID=7574 RepID=A0A1S3HWZ7_LINAN|nr:MAM domain-containing protein 2-like [Lingula anatina]|eukprot:XP_013390076.1 MAM domain-containing protein 2-like [Lingula anatina]